jgi:polyisoprenoid-binding protein YceI
MSTTKFEIDQSHSSINFTVRHLMVSKVRGQFAAWRGQLDLDEADLTRSQLNVEIDAASVDTKEPKRDDHLRSADFLEVEKFPTLTFRSTEITRVDDATYNVAGELTIHGVTRPVTLAVDYAGAVKDPWGGERAGFSAHAAISRKDFGLTWNLMLEAGGFVVGDKIEIGIELELIKAARAAA